MIDYKDATRPMERVWTRNTKPNTPPMINKKSDNIVGPVPI